MEVPTRTPARESRRQVERSSGRQNAHTDSVSGERLQVVRVGREGRPVRFSDSDNQGVDRRTSLRKASKLSGSSCKGLWDFVYDVACFQELVGRGVSSSVAVKALDENNGRDERLTDVAGRVVTGILG